MVTDRKEAIRAATYYQCADCYDFGCDMNCYPESEMYITNDNRLICDNCREENDYDCDVLTPLTEAIK